MKLTTTTMVTVDGVMQGLGGPAPAEAFLFGRRTYQLFAGSWGTWPHPGGNPIRAALNTKPKYVASTTLTAPRWANTTVLTGDLIVVHPEGVTIQVYRPTGRPQYQTATPDRNT
jgi:hypothetical protein